MNGSTSLVVDSSRRATGAWSFNPLNQYLDRIAYETAPARFLRSAGTSRIPDGKHFPVQQTGKNPAHHTVELPKPVTPEVAKKFNAVFKPKE